MLGAIEQYNAIKSTQDKLSKHTSTIAIPDIDAMDKFYEFVTSSWRSMEPNLEGLKGPSFNILSSSP